MGHSAGGHLAFWLAGRHHIVAGSPIQGSASGIVIREVIALAGAVDLGILMELARGEFAHDRQEIERLMGGTPEELPERYHRG